MTSEEDKQRIVQTMLPSSFWFWFSSIENMNEMQNEMNGNLKEVGSFESAEEFWGIYQYIRRPQYLKAIIPIVQDPKNREGGQFFFELQKNHQINKMWEDLLTSFLITTDKLLQINGIMLNANEKDVEFSIWTQNINEQDQKEVERWINENLGRQIDQKIEYRKIKNKEQESVNDDQKILDMLNQTEDQDNKSKKDQISNQINNSKNQKEFQNKNIVQNQIGSESNDFEDSDDDIQQVEQLRSFYFIFY